MRITPIHPRSTMTGCILLLASALLLGCGGEGAAPAPEPSAAFSSDCPPIENFQPLPEVRASIETNEKVLLVAALAQDEDTLDRLLSDSMSYVHENGQISTKQRFFDDYLSKGYAEAVAEPKEEMRQFCSTVFTVSTGHLRLNGEPQYPTQTVTHVWAKQGEEWKLVHRHESHKGGPIGPQLPQTGSVNDTDQIGAEPTPEVAAIIRNSEDAWVNAMVSTNRAVMEGLVAPSLQYVHVTDHTSTRDDFMKELMGGFTETDFQGTTLRQFGNTVIALHNAHYRHVNQPDQSRSQAMHAWVNLDGRWMLAARHSARFEPY